MRELSKEDVIQFYKQFISDSDDRRKLSCHVLSTCEGGAATCDTEVAAEAGSNWRQVSDITAFKSSLPLYPLAKPFVEVTSLRRQDP